MDGFTVDGQSLTPEGVAAIEARRSRKTALLEEARAERVAAYANRHSHVGAEIGRGLAELTNMQLVHAGLAVLSNAAMAMGREEPAGTLAALANGVVQAAHERYGAEGVATLTQHEIPQLGEIMELAVELGLITYPSEGPTTSELLLAREEPMRERITEAMADTQATQLAEALRTQTPPEDGKLLPEPGPADAVAEPMAPVDTDTGVADVANLDAARTEAIEYASADEDFAAMAADDLPAADEPALSPEPEGPQAATAAQRRAAKRAAKGV